MSIRLKLILSNIAMSLIPFFAAIILAIAVLISLVHGSNIQKFQSQGNLEKAVLDKYQGLARELIINPQKIKDTVFLSETEKSLKKFDAALVVVYQDKVYFSDERIDETDFLKSFLSSKNHNKHKVQVSTYIEILNNDIILPGNEKYTLYILINWKPIIDFCISFLERFSIGLILIIIVTNGFLTFLISKGIIAPLNKLKSGVENIKNGNLNFSTDDESKNEFGDVLRAFEEMRERLKDSIEKQITYDENRNEFIESITHDLKTPITSIKGYIEGLKDGVADTPEKTKKYIDTIYKKTVDMDRLINDLTFYSNQKLNKIPFNFSKANLKSFINDMVEEYQLELENAGIKIESFVNCEDNLKVKADIEKLKRVIANLIENSKKYNDKPSGKIILNACVSGSKAIISIEDNGEGIKEESLPFIFDRFYRADPARNSSKGGSGLGLSIAKQIIEGHGGKIWAESKYGEGTKISFEIYILQ